jgi:hypothetical protein
MNKKVLIAKRGENVRVAGASTHCRASAAGDGDFALTAPNNAKDIA